MIKVNQLASYSRTVSNDDVILFSELTGDFNPVHLDELEAKKSIFGERIVHGMLSASYISTVIAMHLPGAGSIYLEQNIKFLMPVKIGDKITAHVKVLEINNSVYTLHTWVENKKKRNCYRWYGKSFIQIKLSEKKVFFNY